MERDADQGKDRRDAERGRRPAADLDDDERIPLDDVGPLPPEGMPVDDV